MNLLSQLAPQEGSKHYSKRLGRGRGSGLGQTSGKGHKGQLARSGGKVRRGFEGGQSPLVRRLPKFGFSNQKFESKVLAINIRDLESFEGDIDPVLLSEENILPRGYKVKIIGSTGLSKKLKIKAHYFSKGAIEAIKLLGGSAEEIK